MSTTTRDFRELVEGAADLPGVLLLLEALGFRVSPEPIPRPAWRAWGLDPATEVRRAMVAGAAGSLDALLLELHAAPTVELVSRLARGVRHHNPVRLHLHVAVGPGCGTIVLGTFDEAGEYRHLWLERDRLRASDVEALEEMAARPGEKGLALALRQVRALDRARVTGRFFREFRGRRDSVAAAWTGLPRGALKERRQLALLFLCRLVFLYFIQRRGALAGDEGYLAKLMGQWGAGVDPGTQAGASTGRPVKRGLEGDQSAPTFFRARLRPLFFGALNRRPEDRDGAARALGDLPYLNGGLFEPHALERRFPRLDLPDEACAGVIEGLLERYRFTAREGGDGAGFGVDPEILGRVFEGLMAPDDRGDTGSFYTPAPVVDRLVREAVASYVGGTCSEAAGRAVADGTAASLPEADRRRVRSALRRVRVLDPACGSGAFLLGALKRLADALGAVSDQPSGEVRRELVGGALHGVDLLDDAALLCSLRLWLALSVDDEEILPLPNLDRRIRQGDALVDPLDLALEEDGVSFHPLRDAGVRRALQAVGPAGRRYLESGPDHRTALRTELTRLERELAGGWLDGVSRSAEHRLRRLEADAAERDLFGAVPDRARRAAGGARRVEKRLAELERTRRELRQRGALPFFSFGVHFADVTSGFDLIISNPPWVRAHRWPARLRAVARRFEVCRSRGWRAGTRLAGAPPGVGGQVDLSMLFLERATRLLAPAGVLAMVVPAKCFRALYGAPARRLLLQDLELASVEDHSLDQRAMFRVDAFPGVVIGRRRSACAERSAEPGGTRDGPVVRDPTPVRVELARRGVAPLRFEADPRNLPLFPDDPESPWVLVPPAVRAAIRSMQRAGPPLGECRELRVRRGVMTGANNVLVMRSVQPKLGGLARVEAEGAKRAAEGDRSQYRAYVELCGIRPLVRGSGIDAFRYRTDSYVVWCRDGKHCHAEPPQRLAAYLERHRGVLEARSGWRSGLPLGAVFRVADETVGHKVAWQDLSDTVRAVALPPTREVAGSDMGLIPLNTVYFMGVPDRSTAVLLAGLLNSLPVRVMARAVAERAKDARFRFFAWTLSCLPLPTGWKSHSAASELLRISRAAHERCGIGGSDELALDRAAASLYGLGSGELEAMAGFDRWLRGEVS